MIYVYVSPECTNDMDDFLDHQGLAIPNHAHV